MLVRLRSEVVKHRLHYASDCLNAFRIFGSIGELLTKRLLRLNGTRHLVEDVHTFQRETDIQIVRGAAIGDTQNSLRNQEINGITFGSVGSGTTIDHVQVTYANDDSYEWFGGTVNAKNLISYKGVDDDFDTDNGFSGKVQFGLAIRDKNTADQSGSNGFESDNDSGGNPKIPFTSAQFSNMTILGGKATNATSLNIQFQNGAQIRRNSKP